MQLFNKNLNLHDAARPQLPLKLENYFTGNNLVLVPRQRTILSNISSLPWTSVIRFLIISLGGYQEDRRMEMHIPAVFSPGARGGGKKKYLNDNNNFGIKFCFSSLWHRCTLLQVGHQKIQLTSGIFFKKHLICVCIQNCAESWFTLQ